MGEETYFLLRAIEFLDFHGVAIWVFPRRYRVAATGEREEMAITWFGVSGDIRNFDNPEF